MYPHEPDLQRKERVSILNQKQNLNPKTNLIPHSPHATCCPFPMHRTHVRICPHTRSPIPMVPLASTCSQHAASTYRFPTHLCSHPHVPRRPTSTRVVLIMLHAALQVPNRPRAQLQLPMHLTPKAILICHVLYLATCNHSPYIDLQYKKQKELNKSKA